LADAENHLMSLLPRKDRLRLLSRCESVDLAHEAALCTPGRPAAYAYFPKHCIVSLVVPIDAHDAIEVAMVGSEGMLGVHQLLSDAANDAMAALVAVPGAAWRISAPDLRLELDASPALRLILGRYLQVLRAQLATAAGCLHFHQIGPRLARWLLMTQDRAHNDHFHVTHEFLARMLGVRRVGVTVAAIALQRGGLVGYHRGEVEILDRGGLEAASCSCYSADRRAYTNGMR
jgi:CRP-like cAMP-binding protein